MDRLEDFIQKKQCIQSSGGKDANSIQHNLNKMTARERIELLLDSQSFVEVGTFVKEGKAGVITGYGTINDRLVYVYAYDFDAFGGIMNMDCSDKICNLMNMALKMGAPLIQIIDSVGADLKEGALIFKAYGRILNLTSKLSGVIPQISIIAGPCNGVAAINAAMSDFTIISEENGSFYVNSPDSITKIENKYVAYDMYAHSANSMKNGSIQLSAANDKEAIVLVKKVLGYIPSNNMEFAQREELSGNEQVVFDKLNDICKDDTKDVYDITNILSDKDSVIEFDKNYSICAFTAFSKINGIPVGIVATNPKENDGYINKKATEKITRFIKICNTFNISIISIVDCKGFEPNLIEEQEGLAYTIAKMTYALNEAVVPKVALVTGKAYGSAYITLASKDSAFDMVYAWPNASICISRPENIINSMYKDEIVTAENPKEAEKALMEKHLDEVTSPYNLASKGQLDDIIMPSETKAYLYMALDMLQSKREVKYPRKHGSMLI